MHRGGESHADGRMDNERYAQKIAARGSQHKQNLSYLERQIALRVYYSERMSTLRHLPIPRICGIGKLARLN